jgi:hypothetical protein
MSLVWELPKDSINATQTSILLRMADFAADDGTSIYPGVNRISDDCKLNRETVRDNIKILLEKQFLILVKNAVPELHRANVYKMNVDKLKNLVEKPLDINQAGGVAPPGGGGATPPGGGGVAPPDPSLRSTIKNQQHAVAELEELLKDKNNEKLIDEWISEHGNEWHKKLWKESKLHAVNNAVGYLRVLLREKRPQSKDLAANRPHETPEETLAKMKPSNPSKEMPDYIRGLVRGKSDKM